jgi:hypothetical protein
MKMTKILVSLGVLLFAADAMALVTYPCACTTETQWTNVAKAWGAGTHYLYNLQGESIRKYYVHQQGGGTQPESVEPVTGGQSATIGAVADSRGYSPNAMNLVAEQQAVESIYLDDFADWVLAYELTGGTMKTTVTLDLGAAPAPTGFPADVLGHDVYAFANTSSYQNALTDWIQQQAGNSQDLPTAAAQALAALSNSQLQLDTANAATINFIIILPNGQKIYVSWVKGQPHPQVTELRDASGNTVPRNPNEVNGNYSFGNHHDEMDPFWNYLHQMGVDVEENQTGSVWVIACTRAGGQLHCQRVRSS